MVLFILLNFAIHFHVGLTTYLIDDKQQAIRNEEILIYILFYIIKCESIYFSIFQYLFNTFTGGSINDRRPCTVEHLCTHD